MNSHSEHQGVQGIQPVLELSHVSKYFMVRQGLMAPAAKLQAVDDVSLMMRPGECLGLVGESGCGKSTLGRLACGLLRPDAGSILLDGKNLEPIGAGSRHAGRIQMVFQDPGSSLDPRMTVLDAICEPLQAQGAGAHERKNRAAEMLALVGLKDMGGRYPHQFSGGQRQRIAVARALATGPDVVVCDEPVSALDASVQAQILNLLKDMGQQFKPAYLFISHDLAVVGFMCSRILVMYLGRIVEEADKADFFAGPGHPYSRALLCAMPKGGTAWSSGRGLDKLPPPLPGELPSPIDPPKGCHFHPRCPMAQEICRTTPPPWRNLAPAWRVRCHFAGRIQTA